MVLLRIALGLALAYVALGLLVWRFQERIAFPAPRTPLPDPRRVGLPDGECVQLAIPEGTPLVGWYLPPRDAQDTRSVDGTAPPHRPADTTSSHAALLWFYGNGETVGDIWPILRDFQPPRTALLALDYPGYGGSGGRTTEAGLYQAADAAFDFLRARPGIDPRRIFVYGRSLGTAVASYTAARHPVAGLILESPFTNAREMSGQHYGLFPRFIVRLELDNLARVAQVQSPVLIFHGTADRLVPPTMGRRVAAAVRGPVQLVWIDGAGHNETYALGGRSYRDTLWAFVGRTAVTAPPVLRSQRPE